LWNRKYLTIWGNLSSTSSRVAQSLFFFCVVFCRSVFVRLTIVLSVSPFTASDYPFAVFTIFCSRNGAPCGQNKTRTLYVFITITDWIDISDGELLFPSYTVRFYYYHWLDRYLWWWAIIPIVHCTFLLLTNYIDISDGELLFPSYTVRFYYYHWLDRYLWWWAISPIVHCTFLLLSLTGSIFLMVSY
jgi:hypothetical protein